MLTFDLTQRTYRHVVLYGAAGTGKTTAAARFPKPLLAQDSVSRGADFMDAPRFTIKGADDLTALADEAMNGGLKEFRTVVLDDFSNMAKRIVDGAETKNRDARAKYTAAYAKIIPAVQRLFACPVNVVITTHYETGSEWSEKDGKTRMLIQPNLPDKLNIFVLGICDVIAYTFTNGKFCALTGADANEQRRIMAKTRGGLTMDKIVAMDDLPRLIVPSGADAPKRIKK